MKVKTNTPALQQAGTSITMELENTRSDADSNKQNREFLVVPNSFFVKARSEAEAYEFARKLISQQGVGIDTVEEEVEE